MTPLAALLKKHQVKALGYEDRRMSVSAYHQYEQALPCRLTPLGGRLEEVRQVKEEGEVECIVIAQRMAEAAFEGGGCGEVLSIPTLDALLKTLPKLVQTGDTILVKASHAMHFEKVVEKLQTL